MILVDSWGWIEFFTDGPLSENYFGYLKESKNIITPTVILYEVYKKIKKERTEEEALIAIAQMSKTKIVPLNENIALSAADYSLKYSLPMAEAIVYATSTLENARLVTSDKHFENLPFVIFIGKK